VRLNNRAGPGGPLCRVDAESPQPTEVGGFSFPEMICFFSAAI
jgi:hypothetical protein